MQDPWRPLQCMLAGSYVGVLNKDELVDEAVIVDLWEHEQSRREGGIGDRMGMV